MSYLPDYYKLLQVDPQADPDVITAAFRVLARRLHPDRDASGVQEHRMAELNRAYAVLRDRERRRTYDAELTLARQPVGPGTDSTPAATGSGAIWERREASAQGEETKLSFGRYTGNTLREIARQDPDYLRWLSRHSSGLRFRDEIARLLREPTGDAYSPRVSR